ncbi:MAG: SPOR domain-containing protein [Candidatus Nitrotoga sp.]
MPGIIIGVTVGLIIAGGVAWYILKSPGVKPPGTATPPEQLATEKSSLEKISAASAPAGTAGIKENKPRFEFYKVLTDNAASPASKIAPKITNQPVVSDLNKQLYYLQIGSFANAEDADKLKAKLALMGMEASVQVATIPDKGVWHRVRLGPYMGQSEANQAREALKLNGVEGTPLRAQ